MALIHPEEALEYAVLILGRDADSGIGNGDGGEAALAYRAYLYAATLPVVLYGVVAEIVDDAVEKLRHALHRGAHALERERNIGARGFRFETVHGVFRNAEQIDLAGKVLAPGFIDLHVHLRQPGTPAAETIARIPEMKLLRASPSWVLASVSYVGISVVWLASYLTSIGRRAKSIASASVGAAGGVIAFYIGMLLIYFAIMLNIDELAGAQIPMLILAGRISPVTSGVVSILIVTGIYTASVPLLWQTAFRLAEEGSLRFRRIAAILAAAGIAASLLLPFNRLMNIVYVLIGYLGFLLLACMVLKAAKIIK